MAGLYNVLSFVLLELSVTRRRLQSQEMPCNIRLLVDLICKQLHKHFGEHFQLGWYNNLAIDLNSSEEAHSCAQLTRGFAIAWEWLCSFGKCCFLPTRSKSNPIYMLSAKIM